MSRDRIFKDRGSDEPFRFDASVAEVFPDMLERSIPGYAATIEAIGSLAARFVRPGTRCYDLGCSLGAASIAMRQAVVADGCRIIAVDNSRAMIERCAEIIAKDAGDDASGTPIELVEADLRELAIDNASMVVLNYTLQFVARADRDRLLRRICAGMVDGGVLVLSEKVIDDDPEIEALLVDLYHEHKRRNDYSALEIARKRTALENVLVPESVATHRARLEAAGFRHSGVWLRYYNFVSIVAIR